MHFIGILTANERDDVWGETEKPYWVENSVHKLRRYKPQHIPSCLYSLNTTTAYRSVFAKEYSPREKATPGGSVIAKSVLKRKHTGRERAPGARVCDNLACYKGCF